MIGLYFTKTPQFGNIEVGIFQIADTHDKVVCQHSLIAPKLSINHAQLDTQSVQT